VIGRIYDDGSSGAPPELRWFWSVTAIWPATPGVTNGTAAMRGGLGSACEEVTAPRRRLGRRPIDGGVGDAEKMFHVKPDCRLKVGRT
jgi:hypothetical protein